jgi:hypothetical protein
VDSSKSSFKFKKEGLRKGMGAVKANPKKSSKSKIVKLFLFMFYKFIKGLGKRILVFVPLFQSLSKGDSEYKLLIIFVPRADFSISPLERKRERLKKEQSENLWFRIYAKIHKDL